ncbi:MAG: TrmB family transcriptional regulator [Lachnospiraceae bacterium]|nr:TrmB family transcriptional regulator [Lachnospiraceae bacterium]
MEENAVLDKLGIFGLTRQEASIYLCLYRNGALTGYEVAKLTGISRSNVYSGLSGLSDKGAAFLEEGNSSKYVAVPIENFCENKIRSMNKEKEFLLKNIPAMKKQEVGYITINGSRNIYNKIINMINDAEKRIYFSASLTMIEEFRDEFLKVLDRKIKLVLITDGLPEEKELVNGAICYVGGDRGNSIRVIIDSEYALTGEMTGKKDDTFLYTGQENFIKVFKEALSNEIRLIELTGGERNE